MAQRKDREDRRARAAQIQDAQRRAERRRSLAIIVPAVLVAALLVGSAVYVTIDRQRQDAEVAAAAKKPIGGVKSFSKLTNNHVQTQMDYPQTPSVGGDHAGVWTNCGAYTKPVEATQATHSLEHGAVWIGYDPTLPSSEVKKLTALANANDYVLVSPVAGVPAPVTASAWGKQLGVQSADDPKLAAFVTKYQLGKGAPEPGASCDGGVGGA